VAEAGLAAASQAGYPAARDISGGLEDGFGWCDLSIVDGRRESAADAYLTPALGRPNLDVVVDAQVHRVLFDGDRCTGVEYRTGGELVRVAAGEVVLAAGAVGTPQLLMLSGIGPQDHLREIGVEVLADLPGVGGNLHDHPMCGIVYRSAREVPPGANNHGEALGLVATGIGEHGPDVQIMFVDVPLRADGLPGPDIGDGYTIVVSPMAPFSRGRIRLGTAEPGAGPAIDPRYYSDRRDREMVVAGLRIAREIGSASAFEPWCAEEVLPGEEDLHEYVLRNLRSYSHYGGTCAIGSHDVAVVDTDLRVHGLTGLRIADASVMPAPISANTNATVFAIAERAAHLLTSRA
jgi:choline dehydrogenase